eukprot:604823-Prymnesium_polylepis.1
MLVQCSLWTERGRRSLIREFLHMTHSERKFSQGPTHCEARAGRSVFGLVALWCFYMYAVCHAPLDINLWAGGGYCASQRAFSHLNDAG